MFVCQICSKTFNRKNSLKPNVNEKHLGLQRDVNPEGEPFQKEYQSDAYPSFKPFQEGNQDPQGEIDIRLKENFKLLVSGPSRCGKTVFISHLLENIHNFSKFIQIQFYIYL